MLTSAFAISFVLTSKPLIKLKKPTFEDFLALLALKSEIFLNAFNDI